MKNSILKRLLIVFAMVCLILTTMTSVVAASAEVQTGIDLVIGIWRAIRSRFPWRSTMRPQR